MGLFDWLNDAMGSEAGIGGGGSNMPTMKPPDLGPPPVQPTDGMSMGGVDPMGNATGAPVEMPTLPMPPVQRTGEDSAAIRPPDMSGNMGRPVDMSTQPNPAAGFGGARMPPQPPYPQGEDPMMPSGTSSNGPGLPIPLPRPRPKGADPSPAGPPLDLTSAVQSYQKAGGNLAPPPDAAPQGGPISRALGLDPNRAKSMVGGLAAGLTAAGNSAGKSPFQALTGGAGASLEGSQKTEDKTYDQKIKYLQAAVAAQSAGDKAAYNKNYASYLAGKLKADTDKAASDGTTGKKGAWNKPDSQKFIDAQHALASDPEVKASQKLLEQAAKSMEPADIAKAQAAHAALIKDKEAKYLAGVGLDPQKTMDLAKNPPGSPNNPHVVTSQSDFDTYVKPGQAYRNPRDGKVYIRKGGEAPKGGDSGAPEGGGTSAPAAPGPPPNPMGGTTAADDEE